MNPSPRGSRAQPDVMRVCDSSSAMRRGLGTLALSLVFVLPAGAQPSPSSVSDRADRPGLEPGRPQHWLGRRTTRREGRTREPARHNRKLTSTNSEVYRRTLRKTSLQFEVSYASFVAMCIWVVSVRWTGQRLAIASSRARCSSSSTPSSSMSRSMSVSVAGRVSQSAQSSA